MTDDEFWNACRDQSLDKNLFTHEGHLRFGWILLQKYSLKEAVPEARTTILALASAYGAASIYHETITQAYLILLNHEINISKVRSFTELKNCASHLFVAKLGALKPYYSESYLFSDDAKHRFMPPDLKQFPDLSVRFQ